VHAVVHVLCACSKNGGNINNMKQIYLVSMVLYGLWCHCRSRQSLLVVKGYKALLRLMNDMLETRTVVEWITSLVGLLVQGCAYL
jgi:hypothetical protein